MCKMKLPSCFLYWYVIGINAAARVVAKREVRPRPDRFTSHRVALAGRSWAGPVQAQSDCSPVHVIQGSTISGRLLHTVLRHRQSSTSSLRQPLSARRATTLQEQVWSSGLLHRRPCHLELSTISPPWPVSKFWLLQNGSASLYGVPVTLAH